MKCIHLGLLILSSVLILISSGAVSFVVYTEFIDKHLEANVSDVPHFDYDWFDAQNRYTWMDRIEDLHNKIPAANTAVESFVSKIWTRMALIVLANIVITFSVLLCAVVLMCLKSDNNTINTRATNTSEIELADLELSMETSGVYDTPWTSIAQPVSSTVVETSEINDDYSTVYTPTSSTNEEHIPLRAPLAPPHMRPIVLFFPENLA